MKFSSFSSFIIELSKFKRVFNGKFHGYGFLLDEYESCDGLIKQRIKLWVFICFLHILKF